MAVYTEIHDDELSPFIELYDIGSLLSYRGIAEGVENSNFLLHTRSGHYILTLYEKRVREVELPFFLSLMQHLAKKSFPCPQPIAQTNGKLIGNLADRPAAIVSFLEGIWIRKPDVRHCAQLGVAMAKLHNAAKDFKMQRKNSLSIEAWRPLWEATRGQVAALHQDIEDSIERELDFLENNWPDGLPIGVIHADLFTDNVFFIGDQLSGIIDFYFACTDILSYDIAITLNAWCFERDFSYNLTKGQALLSHYLSERQLHKREIEAMPILARGSAMRFFLTRLYDWFHTPAHSIVVKKDPLEYWRKLNFFQNISAPSELGF